MTSSEQRTKTITLIFLISGFPCHLPQQTAEGGATGAIRTTSSTVTKFITKFMLKPRFWEPPIKLHVSPGPAALGVDEEALVMASHKHIHDPGNPKNKSKEGKEEK